MLAGRAVAGLFLTTAAFALITGTAAAEDIVIIGNVPQVPVEVDANVCGNTINIVGLLNPSHGTVCVNE